MWFESSVNSYGGKTVPYGGKYYVAFESSVNSYGGKTRLTPSCFAYMFESSVNSYGGKTGCSNIASDMPVEYPIPENKRINKYKKKWCA